MVRLNGVNQALRANYPAPINWNALFTRISFNPSRFPSGTEYLVDFMLFSACFLKLLMIHNRLLRWYIGTTSDNLFIDEATGSWPYEPTDEWGAVHTTLAWDGSNVAVYIGNRRVYIAALSGAFSGPTPSISIGSGHESPETQPFQGDIGHFILHNAIPAPYSGLPENVYDGELTAKEFLRVHGLDEDDVLVLYDWRANDGTNYGSGGSGYNLTPYNNPTFLDNDFQYSLADETTPTIEYPRGSVLAARLRTPAIRARVRR